MPSCLVDEGLCILRRRLSLSGPGACATLRSQPRRRRLRGYHEGVSDGEELLSACSLGEIDVGRERGDTRAMPYRTSGAVGVSPAIVVTTGADIPGQRVVAILGVVRGIALRGRAGDGEQLTSSIAARQGAETRLIDEARSLAHAVIGMRYDSNDAEVVAYGTAVRLEPA